MCRYCEAAAGETPHLLAHTGPHLREVGCEPATHRAACACRCELARGGVLLQRASQPGSLSLCIFSPEVGLHPMAKFYSLRASFSYSIRRPNWLVKALSLAANLGLCYLALRHTTSEERPDGLRILQLLRQ